MYHMLIEGIREMPHVMSKAVITDESAKREQLWVSQDHVIVQVYPVQKRGKNHETGGVRNKCQGEKRTRIKQAEDPCGTLCIEMMGKEGVILEVMISARLTRILVNDETYHFLDNDCSCLCRRSGRLKRLGKEQ